MSNKGLLISFEGCEGSGKTTQANILTARLHEKGYPIVRVREPGGTKLGDIIRDLVQHDSSGEVIEPETESLLFAASRAQMVKQVVDPALAAGEIVISDRYVDSAVAYQGYGREMGADLIATINRLATGSTMPSVTFLIDFDVRVGMRRMQSRNIASGGESDRIEREDISFHERVRAGYLEIAKKDPDRFVLIDGTLDQDAIAELVWGEVVRIAPHVLSSKERAE